MTSLLTISERAIGNGRQTVLAGIGSAVLWYDPFCDDDDDGATTTEKRKTMASRKDSLLASCPVALPEGARVHGMRREPALDDAEGNRFGVVVWGGNFASALALRASRHASMLSGVMAGSVTKSNISLTVGTATPDFAKN